jgi:hypothetical protein
VNLLIGIIEVLVGAFALFTIARIAYPRIGGHSKWGWVIFVGGLAVLNMLIHRVIGSSINPPFNTAVLFGVTIFGLAPRNQAEEALWFKRAIYAIAFGTILGWASYAEIVSKPF